MPAALVANGHSGGAATVMEEHGLLVVIERVLNAFDKRIAKDATARELGAVFEVDKMDGGGFVGFDGELVERNDSFVLRTDVVVRHKWGGGAEDSFAHYSSETESGVFGVLVLMIGGLVGLVDDD